MKSSRSWWRKSSRRSQRFALLFCLCLLGFLAASSIYSYQWIKNYPQRSIVQNEASVTIDIPQGTAFLNVLELLEEHGILPSEETLWFRLYVLHLGSANKISAGEHTFHPGMTAEEVVAELLRVSPVKEIRVTIPEGKHHLEIADILANAGLSSKEQLIAAMHDEKLLAELGIANGNIEGYLFPDTYRFVREATPEAIVRRMVQRYRQVYAELRRRYRDSAQELQEQLGWGEHEILTLASIVEKETGAAHERPLIAGVFFNRLLFPSFNPKLLQTDPTIIYGCTVPEKKSPACQQFSDRIRTIHLRDKENPYNTYTHEKLPPGPISNPGLASLEAVFAPKKSRFLYFVARDNGTHHFSKTRAEHEEAVNKYIRNVRSDAP